MISVCYIWDDTYKEIIVIVKSYLYIMTTSQKSYIKLDNLVDRYSTLVLDKCFEDGGTQYCSIFISYINSENKLEIYNYKLTYSSTNYIILKSIEINLINSLGQISSNNCQYISCQKAKNGDEYVLVCFYENDNSEIGAITLNLDSLAKEKEVKLKKNSGAKSIKSVLFDNDQKVFVCYINSYDNIACVTFDEPNNIFLNEIKYIETMTQPSRYFNIDYFSSQNQYVLSTYSSATEFEYIIFDENMDSLNDNSVNKIQIGSSCDDVLSFTIYYYDLNYKIAQKCGDDNFSSNSVSEVTHSESYSFEEIIITVTTVPIQTTILTTYITTVPIKTTILTTYITTIPIKTTILTTYITTVPIKTTILTTHITTIPIQTTILTTHITTVPIQTTILTTHITTIPIQTTILTTHITIAPIKTTILTTHSTTVPKQTTILTTHITTIPIQRSILTTHITTIPIQRSILTTHITTIPIKTTDLTTHITTLPKIIHTTTIKTKISTIISQKSTILNQAINSTITSTTEARNINKETSTITKPILSSSLITSHETEEIKCSNEIILQNKCKDKIIPSEQAKDIQSILRNEIINGTFNNTNNTIIKTKNIIYQVSTIKEQKDSDLSYISSIELDECEEIIRKEHQIKEGDDLIILKTDILDTKDPSKIIVQYEIYDPYTLEMIPLDICDDTTININIPVALDDVAASLYKSLNSSGYNLFDLNDSFYNDVCTTYTTEDGTDLVLVDRMNIYQDNAQNVYLCQEGCEFIQYNETTKKSKCNCNIQNKLSTMDIKDIKFDKSLIVDDFLLKSLTNSNFRVLKCYKLIFSLKGQLNNIGSYLISAIIFLLVILMISYCIFGRKRLVQYVQLIIRQKINEKKIDKKNKQINKSNKSKNNKDTKDKNKKSNNSKEAFKRIKSEKTLNNNKDKKNKIEQSNKNNKGNKNNKDNKKNKNNKNNKDNKKNKNNKNNNNNKLKKSKNSYPPKKSPTHLDLNISTSKNETKKNLLKRSLLNQNKKKIKGIDIKLSNKKTTLGNKKGNKKNNNIIKLNYINKINIYSKFETISNSNKNKIEKIKVLNDIEMNSLEYQEALILDKRTYMQYYCSLLKTKHLILFTFFLYNDYNIIFIKIFLFLLGFTLYLTVNGFFFTDETMHKINEDKGAFNIIFQIPQILYSTVISAVINLILKKLSLSESQILSIKQEKNIKQTKILGDKIISCLKIKFIIFFIISFLLSLFFWYFIAAFCAVYKNTQMILIKNTLISFGLSMVYPFGLNLLPGIFRIPALRAPKKDKKCLYKVSTLAAMI